MKLLRDGRAGPPDIRQAISASRNVVAWAKVTGINDEHAEEQRRGADVGLEDSAPAGWAIQMEQAIGPRSRPARKVDPLTRRPGSESQRPLS